MGWIALSSFWTTGASSVRKIIWRLVWRNCKSILGLKGLIYEPWNYTSVDTSSSFVMCKISLCLPYNDNKNDAPSGHVVTLLYFPVCFYLFWYCFPDVLDLLSFHSFMLPMSEAASKIFWFFILPYHNFSIFEMLGRDAGNHVWNVKVHRYLCVHTS